jgi:hypothetical protein
MKKIRKILKKRRMQGGFFGKERKSSLRAPLQRNKFHTPHLEFLNFHYLCTLNALGPERATRKLEKPKTQNLI